MDPLEQYYNYLVANKADVPPSFESFRSTLQDDATARTYFDYLKKNQFDAPETYESFVSTLGLKKKAATPLPAGVAGPEEQGVGLAPNFAQSPPVSIQPQTELPQSNQPIDFSSLDKIQIAPSPQSDTDQVRANYENQRKAQADLNDFLVNRGEYAPGREDMTQKQKFAYDNFGVVGGGLYDLGRKVKSFAKDDIPALLDNMNPEDFGGPGVSRAREATKRLGIKEEGTTPEAQAKRFEKAQEQRKEGAEYLRGIPQNWEEAKNAGATGIASYIGSALGMGLSQMPLAVASFGTSSFYLEKDDAYNESIEAIVKEINANELAKRESIGGPLAPFVPVTPEDVITQGLDAPARRISNYVGAINAVLERFGAGKALAPLKSIIQKDLLATGLNIGEAALTEYVTERTQDFNTQVGALLSSGKSIDDIDYQNDIDWVRNRESGRQGMIAGGGLSTITNIASRNANNRTGEEGKGTTEKINEPIQPNAEGQKAGDKEAVQPSTVGTGQGNAEVTPAVLKETKPQENEKVTTDTVPSGAESKGIGVKQEDAESITRAIQDAVPEVKGSQRSTREIKKTQDKELEAYARENGGFIEDIKEKLGDKIDGGTEQDVYLSKDDDTKVIKVNGLSNHSTWGEFWDRINLQNELFPNTGYKLIGFTKQGGRLSAVSEQPYVDGNPVPRQELVQDLAKRGFYQVHPDGTVGQNIFYNEELGVRISDVHEENVIKDADGNIRYIDPVIDRESPFVDEESRQVHDFNKTQYEKLKKPTGEVKPEGLQSGAENVKEEALPVQSEPKKQGAEPKVVLEKNDDGNYIFKDGDGTSIGAITDVKISGENLYMYPGIDVQGKGYGQAAYLEMSKLFPDKKITSGDMSPMAEKMWGALHKKGLAIKFDGGYQLKTYNERNAVSPKEAAKAKLQSLVDSGDLEKTEKGYKVLTDKGGKELMAIKESLKTTETKAERVFRSQEDVERISNQTLPSHLKETVVTIKGADGKPKRMKAKDAYVAVKKVHKLLNSKKFLDCIGRG